MDDNNISGAWDWSQGPPPIMANPDPDAVPLVDSDKVDLGNYDLSGLTTEEQTALIDSLLHGNTEEDLAALQPYMKQQTSPVVQENNTEIPIDLDNYDLEGMSSEERADILNDIQNGDYQTAEAKLSAYEKPDELAQYTSETPLSLKYSNYGGNQLSIKPDSVEYVIKYFSDELLTDLNTQFTSVQQVHQDLVDYAAEDPMVSYDLDITSVETACITAAEECFEAATDVANVAAAIKAYGEGGWNLDACSILNNFLGWPTPGSGAGNGGSGAGNGGSGTGNGGSGSGTSSTDNATDSNADDDTVNVGDNDSALDNIFDLDEGALDNTGGDVVTSYTGGTSGIFDEVRSGVKNGDASTAAKLASLVGIEDLDGDGIIDDEEISEAFSSFGASGFFVPSTTSGGVDGVKGASVAGALGITAAAAAAVGGKVYYDKKKEDEEEKDEVSADETTGTEDEKDVLSELNMVEFKEELLHIGEDDE